MVINALLTTVFIEETYRVVLKTLGRNRDILRHFVLWCCKWKLDI